MTGLTTHTGHSVLFNQNPQQGQISVDNSNTQNPQQRSQSLSTQGASANPIGVQWVATTPDTWGDASNTQGGLMQETLGTAQSLGTQQALSSHTTQPSLLQFTQQWPQETIATEATIPVQSVTMQSVYPSVFDNPGSTNQLQATQAAQQVQELRANAELQQTATERIMMAGQQIGMQKTSGRINIQHNAELQRATKTGSSFDSLTLPQFMWGFVKSIWKVQDVNCKNCMLEVMGHIVKLSQTGGWNTARDTFAEVVLKIIR